MLKKHRTETAIILTVFILASGGFNPAYPDNLTNLIAVAHTANSMTVQVNYVYDSNHGPHAAIYAHPLPLPPGFAFVEMGASVYRAAHQPVASGQAKVSFSCALRREPPYTLTTTHVAVFMTEGSTVSSGGAVFFTKIFRQPISWNCQTP